MTDCQTADKPPAKQKRVARLGTNDKPMCCRCSYPWEGHDAGLGPYNKWCLRRWAAGVVVCFTDQESGEPCFLFGKENRQDGGYNIFWGFGEMHEYMPYETAARECAEETLGLIGTQESLTALFKDAMSLDGEGFLFMLYLGIVQANEILAEYEKRRSIWRHAMSSLKSFAVRGREPGADVMDQLIVVRAKDVSCAVAKRKPLCITLPPKPEIPFAQSCRGKKMAMQPRPPVEWLLEILAKPFNDLAKHLCAFCESWTPPPGNPFSLRFSNPVPGLQANGNPDGKSVASIIAFLATWTGGRGIIEPPSPTQLASDVLALPHLLPIISDPAHVHDYIVEWMSRALDSPAVALLASAHFCSILAGVDESVASGFASVLTQCLCKEMTNTEQQLEANHVHDDTRVAIAYRWLCALHFTELLALSLPTLALKQNLVTIVRTVASRTRSISQQAEVALACLKNSLRPWWLPGQALASIVQCNESSLLA